MVCHPDISSSDRAVLRELPPGAECGKVQRGVRVLPRNIFILLTDGPRNRYRRDRNVARACQREGITGPSVLTPILSLSPFKKPRQTPVSPRRAEIHLPSEIILKILSHFMDEDAVRTNNGSYREYCSLCHLSYLYNSCLISKDWNSVAVGLLYSKLKLDLDGPCEYHWRGIPWGDGVFWLERRHKYLEQRYLKPLLRTLTAQPGLAQYFRSVEIDLHFHMVSDYEMLPYYTKLFALCTKLSAVVGDPCILFHPNTHFPPCQESRAARIADRLSGRRIHRRIGARTTHHQKELQEVLSNNTIWESWRIESCYGIWPPFLSPDWKNLKHLSLSMRAGISGLLPDEHWIACLNSLESLSLSDRCLGVLASLPNNQLIALEVIPPESNLNWFEEHTTDLCNYLSRGAGSSSRLRKLALCIPAMAAVDTEAWLVRTLSHVPNLTELRIAAHYVPDGNAIHLPPPPPPSPPPSPIFADPNPPEPTPKRPFPPCARLQRCYFSFPGWTHNELLATLLERDAAFPALADLVCFRSSVIVETVDAHSGYEQLLSEEVCVLSRSKGEDVDRKLKQALERRGLMRVMDSSLGWRKMRFRREVGGR